MHVRKPSLIALVTLLLSLSVACNNKVTDEDLDRWSNNEEGLKKIEDVVRDTEQPLETRVRALRATLKAGATLKLRSFIERTSDRDALVKGFEGELIKMMGSEKDQVDAKDGLFQILPYLPDDEKDAVQKRVSEWAFEGLDDSSPTVKIKEQIEYRILVSQIEDLGPHGVRGAALLLSRGFAVDRLFRYLVGIGSDEARTLALAAVIRLHQIPDSQVTYAHLERIQEIGTADAAVYLLDLYDGQEDKDIASDAFNRALGMLELPAVRAEKGKLVERMLKYLQGKNADDRWFAARTIVSLDGKDMLGKLIDGFADDKVYDSGSFDPQKSIIDFCETGVGKLPDDPTETLLPRLASENRIAQSIAIVCLKALGSPKAKEALTALAISETSLDDFLGDKLTVGILAQNAADGITMLEEATKKKEGGELTAEQLEARRWHSLVILSKTGEPYAAALEARLEQAARAEAEARGEIPEEEPPKTDEAAPAEEAPKADEAAPKDAKAEKPGKGKPAKGKPAKGK